MIYEYELRDKVIVKDSSSLFEDFPSLSKDTTFTIIQIDTHDNDLPYEIQFVLKGRTSTQWAYTYDLKKYNPIRIGGE